MRHVMIMVQSAPMRADQGPRAEAQALKAEPKLARHHARRILYELAKRRASDLGRVLVVVGDPYAGLHTRIVRASGCGDVCVDLHGCEACPRAITADITKALPLQTDSAVVFVSCVLEYVEDPQAVWEEILRVAGSHDNVFLARVQP